MRRLIILLIFLVLCKMVYADDVTVRENITFTAVANNVTYRMDKTFYGLIPVRLNETCLTLNRSIWCNQSATHIIINITSMEFPIISNLRNTSTTNQSSYIEWNCNENCNYSILWYNHSNRSSNYLIDSIYNNTFKTSHNPYLADLTNLTYYHINLTVWDNNGNPTKNNTFNFTTAKTVIEVIEEEEEEPTAGAGIPDTAGARGGSCIEYINKYKKCFYPNASGVCIEGCTHGYKCSEDYKCEIWERVIIKTESYIIKVKTSKDKYKTNENIVAEITLIQTTNKTDRNGILGFYLLSPSNEKFYEMKEVINFIPPACPDGEYDELEEVCINNDSVYEPQRVLLSRKVAVPKNALFGEWSAYVTYESELQSMVELYDKFKIYSYKILAITIPLVIISAYGTSMLFKKRKLKKKIKKETEEEGG